MRQATPIARTTPNPHQTRTSVRRAAGALAGVGAVGMTLAFLAPAASAATSLAATGAASYATGCPVVGGGQGTASAIRIIQGKLNKLDLAGLTVDGVNGPATTAAIKTFQRTQFITADGVVGTNTWLKLGGCNSTTSSTYTGWVAMGGGSMQDQANIYQSPSFSAKVLGHYDAYAKVTGTLTGEWVRTSAGYVNVGTLENTTSAPASRNGKLATSSMCAVPLAWNAQHSFSGGVITYTKTTQRYLNCIALWHLADLQTAFKARFGKFATIDLTYRSYAEQQYWYKTLGPTVAAYPGTSAHGVGLALDFEQDATVGPFDWGQPGSVWLIQNSSKYGFYNPFSYGTKDESYHFQFE